MQIIGKIEVDLPDTIFLRYYRGWSIQFNTAKERFESPVLCLFGFLTAADLEKAIDATGRGT